MSPTQFAKMQPGSILTHGSIVAREYNIPAVLGLGIATQRIKHGQMISVDGDNALRLTVLVNGASSTAIRVSARLRYHCTTVWRGSCAPRATFE